MSFADLCSDWSSMDIGGDGVQALLLAIPQRFHREPRPHAGVIVLLVQVGAAPSNQPFKASIYRSSSGILLATACVYPDPTQTVILPV